MRSTPLPYVDDVSEVADTPQISETANRWGSAIPLRGRADLPAGLWGIGFYGVLSSSAFTCRITAKASAT